MSMNAQDRMPSRWHFAFRAVIDVVLLSASSAIGVTLLGFFGAWHFLYNPPQSDEGVLSGPMLAWLAGLGALGLMPGFVAPFALWWRYRQFKRQHTSG
jgi:hypothetical protein